MQQNLTEQDLQRTSAQEQQYLIEWMKRHGYALQDGRPLLTLGQQIEFLHEHANDELAYRLHLLLHAEDNPQRPIGKGYTWRFNTRTLPGTLWEGILTFFEQQKESNTSGSEKAH